MVWLAFSVIAFAMPALLSILVLDPKHRAWRRACALLMYLTIVVAGSVPGARAQIGEYATGLTLHSTAYAVLTFLWFTGSSGSPLARAAKAVLAVALMGAGDEFVQSFFPYRGADVRDWLVDCSSALVTSALLCAVLPRLDARRAR
jgi:VanZ family protein